MRIARIITATGLFAATLSLAGCYNDRPGHWGDRHHHHHHHDGDRHHHDRDGRWR